MFHVKIQSNKSILHTNTVTVLVYLSAAAYDIIFTMYISWIKFYNYQNKVISLKNAIILADKM